MQLLRSSSSIGANYIEANESLTKKEFKHRLKIAKKEARQSSYWLDLLDINEFEKYNKLKKEVQEIVNIMGSILNKL